MKKKTEKQIRHEIQYGVFDETDKYWLLYDCIEDALSDLEQGQSVEVYEFKPVFVGKYTIKAVKEK